MKNDTYEISKREKMLADFSKLKVLLAHQLERQYSQDVINRIFERAKKEFEKMIPELPFLNLEEGKKEPYVRLLIFSAMTMSIYFALKRILKDKSLAKKLTYSFFQLNLPGNYSIPIAMLARWMFSRFKK